MENSKSELINMQRRNSKRIKNQKNLIGALLTKQQEKKSPSEYHLYGFPPSIPKSEITMHLSSQKNPNIRKMFRVQTSSKSKLIPTKNRMNSFSTDNLQDEIDKVIFKQKEPKKKKFYDTAGAFYKHNGPQTKIPEVQSERHPLATIQKKMRGKTADKMFKRDSIISKEETRSQLHKRFKSFHNGKEKTIHSILKKNLTQRQQLKQKQFFLTNTNFRDSIKNMPNSVVESKETTDLKYKIISESPFFKLKDSETPSYKSTTIVTQIRQKGNEQKLGYIKAKNSLKKSRSFNLKKSDYLKTNNRKDVERINTMVKTNYDFYGSETENKVRNISYLYDKVELFRPKKKNPIELLEVEETNKKKAKTLNEIRSILEAENFPILDENLFDVIGKMKIKNKTKKRIKEKFKEKNRDDVQDFNKKACNYTRNFKLHGCYERNNSISILKWLDSLKKKYNKESKRFEDTEEYFKAMKDIIAFSNKEVIETEKKRCKETSLLMETLYMDHLSYVQNVFNYLAEFLKQVDKEHKNEIEFVKDVWLKKMEGIVFENRQLEGLNKDLREENLEQLGSIRRMRSKLANSQIVIKSLRTELNFTEEILRMTRLENDKITEIVREMTMDFVQVKERPPSFQNLADKLDVIEKTHSNYQHELRSMRELHKEKEKDGESLSLKEKTLFLKKMGSLISENSLEEDFGTQNIGIQVEIEKPEGDHKEIQTEAKEFAVAEMQTDEHECKECVRKEAIIKRNLDEEKFLLSELNKEKMQIISEKEELEREKSVIEKEKMKVEKEKDLMINENVRLEKETSIYKEKLEEEIKSRIEEISLAQSSGRNTYRDSSDMTPIARAGAFRGSLFPQRVNSPALTIQPPESSIAVGVLGYRNSMKRSSTLLTKEPSIQPRIPRYETPNPNTLGNKLTTFSAMKNRLLTRGDSMYSVGFESNFSQDDDSISLASCIPDDISYSDLRSFGLRKVKKIHRTIMRKIDELEADDDLYDFYKAKGDMYFSFLKAQKRKRTNKSRFRSKNIRRSITRSSFKFASRVNTSQSVASRSKTRKTKKKNEIMHMATSLFNECLQMIKNNYLPKKKKLTRKITLVKEIMKVYTYFEETEKSKGQIKTNFNVFVFRYLRNRNSHKKILSKKYKYLLYSVNHSIATSAVRLFAKFLGMNGSLDKNCMRVYLSISKHLKERLRSKASLLIKWQAFKSVVNFYLKKFLRKLKSKDQRSKIRASILRSAEGYSKISKNNKVIDFDDAMDFILEEHSLHVKDPISEFFETADLNGDGSLDYGEFIRITRHVEKKFYLHHKDSGLKEIFEEFAEVEEGDTEEEKVINPVNFKKLCRTHKIYSLKSQMRFLELAVTTGLTEDVEDLKSKWTGIVKPKLEMALIGIKNEEIKIFYHRLDGLILNFDEKIKHKIWLNFNILESEVERLKQEKYIHESIFPKELKMIDLLYLKEIDDEI